MLKYECKIGMKVRVARVLDQRSYDYTNALVYDMREGLGKILTISGVYGGGVCFEEEEGGGFGWDWAWLEPVEGIDNFLLLNKNSKRKAHEDSWSLFTDIF